MKVMVIGKGGREHALSWKLSKSKEVKKVYVVPGNAGTASIATNIPVASNDITGIIRVAEEIKPDCVVVGPEEPLFLGIKDALEKKNFNVFGPSLKGAILEKEKAFAKRFMEKYNIPTAKYRIFEDPRKAQEYIKTKAPPMVVKASGPALGKGSIVCFSKEEANQAIKKIMVDKIFGKAGDKVVIEDYLEGEEASIMILTNGKDYLPLLTSQDHKPIYDGDKGPNTGGMGAYAPTPLVNEDLSKRIEKEIINPLLEGLSAERIEFKGVLYIGLMITKNLPYVLEFNVRFGDPELQPVLFLLKSDLFPLLFEISKGRLPRIRLDWEKGYATCVVAASKGYPDKYEIGKEIHMNLKESEDIIVFHAGTSMKNGKLLTDGGRVLNVVAKAPELKKAKEKAYKAMSLINFDGIYYRKDIGDKGIKRLYGSI